jgi:hypothetical protein
MNKIYTKVLDYVAIDPRLDSGIFDIANNEHLAIYREYLIKEGISEEQAIVISNILAEAGRFPERQAYNKDGLLVTFPSPEHKQRALSRGTHFEENPKKSQVNIFGTPQPAQAQPAQQAPTPPTTTQPAQAPAQSTEPSSIDTRTAQEKMDDAQAIEKMLKAETVVYTLKEALNFGFYQKDNVWYNTEGKRIGRLWYVDNKAQQFIIP